jgi:hypothetical protein
MRRRGRPQRSKQTAFHESGERSSTPPASAHAAYGEQLRYQRHAGDNLSDSCEYLMPLEWLQMIGVEELSKSVERRQDPILQGGRGCTISTSVDGMSFKEVFDLPEATFVAPLAGGRARPAGWGARVGVLEISEHRGRAKRPTCRCRQTSVGESGRWHIMVFIQEWSDCPANRRANRSSVSAVTTIVTIPEHDRPEKSTREIRPHSPCLAGEETLSQFRYGARAEDVKACTDQWHDIEGICVCHSAQPGSCEWPRP